MNLTGTRRNANQYTNTEPKQDHHLHQEILSLKLKKIYPGVNFIKKLTYKPYLFVPSVINL